MLTEGGAYGINQRMAPADDGANQLGSLFGRKGQVQRMVVQSIRDRPVLVREEQEFAAESFRHVVAQSFSP